jgi:hypothetical protein
LAIFIEGTKIGLNVIVCFGDGGFDEDDDRVRGELELYEEAEFVNTNEDDDEVNELEAQLLDVFEDVKLGDKE